jgi:hypothetical protein
MEFYVVIFVAESSNLNKREMKKKIGILGSGTVGKVLATGFLKEGHEVPQAPHPN